MDNNSMLISSYLQQEMSESERSAFEIQLAADPALQQEVKMQQQIIKAAQDAGLKREFAKAIHHRVVLKRTITLTTVVVISVISFLVLFNSESIFSVFKPGKQPLVQKNNLKPFVDPPLAGINVPVSEFVFDATKGDTILYSSGSIIYFPPSALVDERGAIIKGEVKITYREFAEPVDFFLSGIPMGYDSAGVKYNFESSGMCEINAYKDNKPVFVNPYAMPEINLSGKNKSNLHNLYFLDTADRSWKFKGNDIVTQVRKLVYINSAATTSRMPEKNEILKKPVRPAIASGDKPAFSIEIDPGSFEELFAFDRLKFQVEDESSYRPSDADEHWDNVKLEHTDKEGIYKMTVTNSKRTATYKVTPVLEGGDYQAAMKIFNQKKEAYDLAMKNRLVREQTESDSLTLKNKRSLAKMNADKEWNDRINNLIIARNKKMRALRKHQMNELEKAAAANQKNLDDQLIRMEIERQKYPVDLRLSSEILRSFSINGFGVWNCDHPEYPNNEVPVFATFIDNLKNKISFRQIAVIYKGFNGITSYESGQIRVMPGSENMIWGIKDQTFYYFSYQDFENAKIHKYTGLFTFTMRKAAEKISSYDEVKDLVSKF
ncbi:MAG: hypothetical protein ABIO04_04780 [Ferruginibacter sp.]